MASLIFIYLAVLVTFPLLANAGADCNGTCNTMDDCNGELTCIGNKCDDDPDVHTSICKGGSAAPTAPPIGFISNCDGACNNGGDCDGQLICIDRKCNDDPDIGTNLCKGGGKFNL